MTSALILAGRRHAGLDPLAAAAGVSHKCLVPIAQLPMIGHVANALAASPEIDQIRVSIEEIALVEQLPVLQRLQSAGRLEVVQAHPNLADSVIAASRGLRFPLLITTADAVLLTSATINEMLAATRGADAAVAFARREDVLAAHPDGQRRFYRFGEGSYSNCNSYWLRDATALSLVENFRSGGQFAKHPLRIVGAFGLLNLIRFHYGIGTLASTFERFSDRFDKTIRPIVLSDGAAAIDVDNMRTHAIAEQLLLTRAPMAIAAE